MTGSPLPGTLHIYVAFDWGDEIHLERAQKLIPPASFQELLRRKRTPTSFSYRPAPLRLGLGPLAMSLPELGSVQAMTALTLFDFGAVSLGLRIPLLLSPEALVRLAGALADPVPITRTARTLLVPIFQSLLPAIEDAQFDEDFSEEYF